MKEGEGQEEGWSGSERLCGWGGVGVVAKRQGDLRMEASHELLEAHQPLHRLFTRPTLLGPRLEGGRPFLRVSKAHLVSTEGGVGVGRRTRRL
jgi:hypothetical protein